MTNRSEDGDDPPDAYDDEMFAHRERYAGQERRPRPSGVSDFVRRAIENTVGSVQNTGSLSKEALGYLLQQGDRGRREVVRIVSHEVGQFLRGVDLSGEIVKVLTGVQLEVSASVRFKPTGDKGVTPEVTAANASVSRDDDAEDDPREETGRTPPARSQEPQD